MSAVVATQPITPRSWQIESEGDAHHLAVLAGEFEAV
jgi:hypothetical protein